MRAKHLLTFFLITVCLLAAGISPALAQKGGKGGGKGGGGGDDGGSSDPAVLPDVSYGVSVLPVTGLLRVDDVNDWGDCAAQVRVAAVEQPINTKQDKAAAVIDASGDIASVRYLDNLIDPALPWDLYTATGINNRGQIVGVGVKNDVFVARAYLLTPRDDGTGLYDLTDLGLDGTGSWARDMSEAGDVLFTIDEIDMLRLSDGSMNVLPSSDRVHSGVISSGVLSGQYVSNPSTSFLSSFSGSATELELLQYMTTQSEVALSESGFSFGSQSGPIQKIKGRLVGGTKYVTYDLTGNAVEIQFPFSINGNREITSQVVNGVPLIAGTVGSGSGTDIFGKPWIRFPGYDPVVISDLMNGTELTLLELLNLGGGQPGESESDFMVATPRDALGEVVHAGAPTLYGLAFRYDDASGVGYEGLYVIRPVSAP